MVRERAAMPAALDGLNRHHFRRCKPGIPASYKQHGNVPAEFLREIEAELHVLCRVGIGELIQGMPPTASAPSAIASCISERARLADDAILCEGDDLQIDDAAEFITDPQQRFHRFKARFAVNVGKSPNVQIAVKRRERHGAAGIFNDPRFRIFFFDLGGESIPAIALPIASD